MRNLVFIVVAALLCLPGGAKAALCAPGDYYEHNEHYYSMYTCNDGATAVEAANDVEGTTVIGGSLYDTYLATIDDASEWQFIFNTFFDVIGAVNGPNARFFVSGTDSASEGNFVYNSGPNEGEALRFEPWFSNEPNNNGTEGEDYIEAFYFNRNEFGLNDMEGTSDRYLALVEISFAEVSAPPISAMLLISCIFALASIRKKRTPSTC